MSDRKKILFIINPISGVGRKNTVPPLIERHLNTNEFEWEIQYTRERNHGRTLALEQKAHFDAIVAVGGDGSVNEIGSALINSSCALGILPCGSGNGLARHLRIPLKLEKAIQRIAAFDKITIDTGSVNDIPFLGTCGFGFDAHIAQKFDTFGQRGFLSYIRLVTTEYNSYTSPSFTISGEGVDLQKDAILCSVANSSQFGNGFTISPNSDISDGEFELVFIERFGLLKAPTLARKFFTRSIHTSRHFSSLSFKNEITIDVKGDEQLYFHIDGEPKQAQTPFTVKVNPLSLNII